MPLPANFTGHVFAYQMFHVRTEGLPEFCEVAASLLAASKLDTGRVRVDLHRELPWAQTISNDNFSLFLMVQEWETPQDLEAHVVSAHAGRFSQALPRLLVVEPSVSIFGEPLGTSDLASLSAQATAEAAHTEAVAAAAARAEAAAAAAKLAAASPPPRALGSSGELPPRLSNSRESAGSMRSTASGRSETGTPTTTSRSGSRPSLLAQSGAASLLKQ